MPCFTSWHRCFPGGILAGYQDLISVHLDCFCLDLQRDLGAPSFPVPDKALGNCPESASLSETLGFCRAGHSLVA